MEWYEDPLIKFINKYTAPNKCIDLTENDNFISFKKEYIHELKTINNDNGSKWYNKFQDTIIRVEGFFDIVEDLFFKNIQVKAENFLRYIREIDIQEYHLGYFYRVVGGNTENKTFFKGDDLYCKPKEKVISNGRYNSIHESTMYLSEQALLCWQECNMPNFFTLCRFDETFNNHLKYFRVKSSKNIQQEASLNYFYGEKQFELIHQFLVLNPLYILLSQRIDECDNNYKFTNKFLKWIRQEGICDGIVYCNCVDYFDARVFEGQRLKYSKYNVAISTESVDLDVLKNCFIIGKTKEYDLEEEMQGVFDKFERIKIIKKHFEEDCEYL